MTPPKPSKRFKAQKRQRKRKSEERRRARREAHLSQPILTAEGEALIETLDEFFVGSWSWTKSIQSPHQSRRKT